MAAAVQQALVGAIGLGYSNYDLVGLLTGLWSTQRGASVDQDFQRQFLAIDYKVQREQMQREDIRDLVDMTVGRMDMYHVVGTLLLAFVMGWYTDNSVIGSNLPTWYVTLFFISNFTAAAYLIFSVWLAMHASIASHSIGVRLLTSYARLSIPSPKELKDIRSPAIVWLDKFLEMGAEFVGRDISNENQNQETRSSEQGTSREATFRSTVGATSMFQPPHLEAIARKEGDDEVHHFRRFAFEQEKWIKYDLYSRLCMSFGMNQLLQSLAYYIFGIVFDKCAPAALASFVAVKALAVLLLRLDVDFDLPRSRKRDLIIVFILHVLPPMLAATLLWHPGSSRGTPGKEMSFWAIPCFLLHAGWLWYLDHEVRASLPNSASSQTRHQGKRLRVASYLNVLSPEQIETVQEARDEECRHNVDVVKNAREDLGKLMARNDRTNPELPKASAKLAQLVAVARNTPSMQKKQDLLNEIVKAECVLEYVAIWQKAPQIYSTLCSLRSENVQSFLGKEQRLEIAAAYQAFVKKCHDMKIGIANEKELKKVRVDYHDDTGLPQNVWISSNPGSDQAHSWEAPESNQGLTTSFCTALGKEFPEWLKEVSEHLERQDSVPLEIQEFERQDNTASHQSEIGVGVERPPRELVPSTALPDSELPARLFRHLTWVSLFSWCFAAVMLACVQGMERSNDPLEAFALASSWPSSPGFLHVNSLSCNDSLVVAGTEFSVMAAQRYDHDRLAFTDSGMWPSSESLFAATFFKANADEESDDHVLSFNPNLESHPWSLSQLRSGLYVTSTSVPFPPSWTVVAVWGALCNQPLCSDVKVAGWDGASIVVAKLEYNNSKIISMNRLFRIQLSRGHCTSSKRLCDELRAQHKYENIKALQFGGNGDKLLVLLEDGLLDVWDLPNSKLLGRWHLGAKYSAMCVTRGKVLLSRTSEFGPTLEEVPLPAALELLVGSTAASKIARY